MIDREKLAEAIHWVSAELRDGFEVSEAAVPEPGRLVLAAARACLDGETIWWCEKHKLPGTDMECGENGMGRRACRMVEAVLSVKGDSDV